jgi:hypothetical protein
MFWLPSLGVGEYKHRLTASRSLLDVGKSDTKRLTVLHTGKLLDALAFWRTRISAAQLGTILGVTRQTAQTAVIRRYREEYPGKLTFTRRANGLPDGATIDDPAYADPDLGNLFHLLVAVREFGEQHSAEIAHGRTTMLGFPAEEIRMPEPTDIEALRRIIAAASHRRAVIGTYAFKEREMTRVRFSPHAMVKTPFRIHFRGFLESSAGSGGWAVHGYRDIVPFRFVDIEENSEDASLPGRDDEWLDEEILRFRLNPELPSSVRFTYATEYQLRSAGDVHYELWVRDRRAFSHYYRTEFFSRTWGEEKRPIWVEAESRAESFCKKSRFLFRGPGQYPSRGQERALLRPIPGHPRNGGASCPETFCPHPATPSFSSRTRRRSAAPPRFSAGRKRKPAPGA